MAKSKTATIPGQLLLFDTSQYGLRLRQPPASYSNYAIEDGTEEADDWPPQPVSESTEEFVSESTEEFVSESNWPPDPPDDSLTNDSLTNDSLTNPNLYGTVGKYHAGGSARGGGEYWRFSYRVGKRVKHRHIPGGCATSAIALLRAGEVREAIALGKSTAQILELIRSWTRKSKIK